MLVAEKTGRDPLWRARELSLAGLLGALALLLPVVFHALGGPALGRVFLPMHLPIIVAGFVVGPPTAAGLGIVVPLLSSALTGMPPLPLAPLMSVELMMKAGVASLVYRVLRLPMWVALPLALVVDWMVLALAAALAGHLFGIDASPLTYVGGVIVVGLPGTLAQLLVVPLGVAAIERRLPRLALDREEER